MPGIVHPFLFATSFFTFSKVMLNSITWLTFSFRCLRISFIYGIYGILSSLSFPPSLSLSLSLSLSQIPPQNSTNFSISRISPSWASSHSSVLKIPFWSCRNMILSCFFLRFSSHFASFIFLYLSLSNHCSLAFLRL